MIAYHHTERPATLPGADLDRYLAAGWFRMHQEVFTTTHLFSGDQAYRVHWLRYAVQDIQERSSHRRIRRKNAGFVVSMEDFSGISSACEKLYSIYRASINFEGADSVAHALFGEGTLTGNIFSTKCITIHCGERLIAAGYFDVGDHSGASILHFFDPEFSRFSLGKYLILLTLDYLRNQRVTHYYPGYVVAGKDKMNYKLFLGEGVATYFDPATGSWRPFHRRILTPEMLSELDRLKLAVALLS
jgi:arginyl-tRNA--protein-N-Asp/Glu arginylyltransferase